MKPLKLKAKENKPFISGFGIEHKDAVIIVSAVNNNIIDKNVDIFFTVYNSENDVDKKPIDNGFILSFNENESEETIINPQTGEVIKWGKPNYTTVLQYFDIVDKGIILSSEQVEAWFLQKTEFKGEPLQDNWIIIK